MGFTGTVAILVRIGRVRLEQRNVLSTNKLLLVAGVGFEPTAFRL